jgi:hypothetical protein
MKNIDSLFGCVKKAVTNPVETLTMLSDLIANSPKLDNGEKCETELYITIMENQTK